MKGKRMTIVRSLLLALLITAMIPLGVSAESNTDNLVLNKQVWLEDNGTYTVQLEAYAKGQVSAETIKVVKPADIILVLDQSGSMVQNNVSGIPTDTYKSVSNVTNGDLQEKSYYYKADDSYYKIIITKEIVSSKVEWVGDDGQIYPEDALSSTLVIGGQTYTTSSPYVTASLETWSRESDGFFLSRIYRYVKDGSDPEIATSWTNAYAARAELEANYDNSYTVDYYGSNAGAAAYIAATLHEENTVWYSYKYIDAEGNEVSLGHTKTDDEAVLDAQVCDIPMVYERGTTTGTRLAALEYAAKHFIESIQASAVKNNIHHRVAVVGFASTSHSDVYYANTELFIGADQYNFVKDGLRSTYNSEGNLASDKYDEAFQDVLTEDGYNNLLASMENLAGEGATYPSHGFTMANGIFEAYKKNETEARSKIIIFFTDGTPGDNASNYNSSEAAVAIELAKQAEKDYNAKVYTVALLSSALSEGSNGDTFLENMSTSGEYTLVTQTEEMENFFESVDKDINNTSTTVQLSENAIVLDRISNYFQVPEGFNTTDNVTVQIAEHLGNEVFAQATAAPESVSKVLSYGLGDEGDAEREIKGASARGFNFISEENVVTTTIVDDPETEEEDGLVVANGNKLIMTITGLLAKDAAATDTYIDTNTTDAGVWDVDAEGEYGIVKAFDMPHTLIRKKSFVIDYAKEAALDVFGLSANRLDSDEDGIFSKVAESAVSLDETYGKAAIAGTELTYEPDTMNWTGFDTFYALGKDANYGDRKTQNLWSKVSVIPANNVYYEDDFVTNSSDGTVGIVYSGEWTTEGTAGNNKETENTAVHGGWANTDLANDTTYTDGTAHVSSVQGATATFTFTGTGVDIYSRTNATTGLIKAQLYKGTEAKASAMTKTHMIDNLAASGDYYQIPTASFTNLEHGTYTVKLTVATTDNRSTYYLDGIRVYNPLSAQQETDTTVSEAYGNEVGAMFKEVRDILLDSKALDANTADTADGVVFIDQMADGTVEGSTSTIGVYEEYGPKNEVYLANGQAIAFYVVGGNVQVGLKAPEGATTAQVTNSEAKSALTIEASSDLFYEIEPNEDGMVIIKNTGDKLLAVTKIKIAGAGIIGEASVQAVLTYADTFDSLAVNKWTLDTEEMIPETDDQEDVTLGDDSAGNVEIENPEPDTGMKEAELLRQLMKQILGVFRNWLAN